jgi:polyphenol oxidase
MTLEDEWLRPAWPAPARVRSLVTTRMGGISLPPYDSLNLGHHVGDAPERVAHNRAVLRQYLPAEPLWLSQVHGTTVVEAADVRGAAPVQADAIVARQRHEVCAIMTADCLPVLLTDTAGSVVGAAHAGWRGLCGGVIEAAVARMGVSPAQVMAYLGPAIGPAAFEVGPEVRAAFLQHDLAAASAFQQGAGDRWLADIYQLARQRLQALGVAQVYGGGDCTVTDAARFFSYRRDGETGRMAALIWID